MNFESIITNIAVTSVFGIGYFLFNKSNNKHKDKKEIDLSRNISSVLEKLKSIPNLTEGKLKLFKKTSNFSVLEFLKSEEGIINVEMYKKLIEICLILNDLKHLNLIFDEIEFHRIDIKNFAFSFIEGIGNFISIYKTIPNLDKLDLILRLNEDLKKSNDFLNHFLKEIVLKSSQKLYNEAGKILRYFEITFSKNSFNEKSYEYLLESINNMIKNSIDSNDENYSNLQFKAVIIFQEACSNNKISMICFKHIFLMYNLLKDYQSIDDYFMILRINYPSLMENDISSYSILIDSLCDNERNETKTKVFEIYNDFLNKNIFNSETQITKDVIPKIDNGKNQKNKISQFTLKSWYLINMFNSVEEEKNEKVIINEQTNSNDKLSVFSSILKYISKYESNLIHRAEEIYNSCLKFIGTINENIAFHMLSIFRKNKRINSVIELYKKFNKEKNIISSNNINFILSTLLDNCKYDSFIDVYNSMNNNDKNSETHYLYIKYLNKTNNFNGFKEFYNFIKVSSLMDLDENIFNASLDIVVKEKNDKIFNQIIKDMDETETEFNIITYGLILKHYQNDIEKMEYYYEKMIKSGLKLNVIVFYLMIKSYLNHNTNKAVKVFYSMMNDYKVSPDQQIFELMFKTSLKSDIDLTLSLIVESIKFNIKVENFVYSGFLSQLKLIKDDFIRKTFLSKFSRILEYYSVSLNESIVKELDLMIQKSIEDKITSTKDMKFNENEVIFFDDSFYTQNKEYMIDYKEIKPLKIIGKYKSEIMKKNKSDNLLIYYSPKNQKYINTIKDKKEKLLKNENNNVNNNIEFEEINKRDHFTTKKHMYLDKKINRENCKYEFSKVQNYRYDVNKQNKNKNNEDWRLNSKSIYS